MFHERCKVLILWVFAQVCQTSSTNCTGPECISMTLMDRTQAVIKADVDLTEMNIYLKTYMQHEIQKSVERQTKDLIETIVNNRTEVVIEQKIKGFAAGPHWSEGGSGANFLCLPKDPEWKDYSDELDTWRGRLYGVEYSIYNDRPPYSRSFHNKEMPCAVCFTNKRSTASF